MFNTWLTYQEKEDFLSKLKSDGWEFKPHKQSFKVAGTSFELWRIHKYPKDLKESNKRKYVRFLINPVNGRYKFELYESVNDKVAKKNNKPSKSKKSKKK